MQNARGVYAVWCALVAVAAASTAYALHEHSAAVRAERTVRTMQAAQINASWDKFTEEQKHDEEEEAKQDALDRTADAAERTADAAERAADAEESR